MFVAMVAMLPMIDLSAMSHSKRSKKKLDSPGLRQAREGDSPLHAWSVGMPSDPGSSVWGEASCFV